MKRTPEEMMEDRLTRREAMVMRCIWNYNGDIPSIEIQRQLNEDFGLFFERTTIATYLLHLQQKGFIDRYKKGQVYYYRPLKDKEQYVKNEARKSAEMWQGQSLPDFVAAFINSGAQITEEDKQKVKDLIEGMDK